MHSMALTVYLSGEIHKDWRDQIEMATKDAACQWNFCFRSLTTMPVMIVV